MKLRDLHFQSSFYVRNLEANYEVLIDWITSGLRLDMRWHKKVHMWALHVCILQPTRAIHHSATCCSCRVLGPNTETSHRPFSLKCFFSQRRSIYVQGVIMWKCLLLLGLHFFCSSYKTSFILDLYPILKLLFWEKLTLNIVHVWNYAHAARPESITFLFGQLWCNTDTMAQMLLVISCIIVCINCGLKN